MVLLSATPFAFGQKSSAAKATSSTADLNLGEHQKKGEGETVEAVLHQIQSRVDQVRTLKADISMSKVKDKKDKKDKGKGKKAKEQDAAVDESTPSPTGQRSVKSGPMAISRGQGARVAISRKDETEEYIANPQILWVYNHKDKEAQFIPTSMPFISGFVEAAMSMNVFAAMEQDTIRNKGSQDVDGEPCWVLEGKSPDKLKLAGVEQVKMRFWIAKKDGIPRRISIPTQKDLIISLNNVQVNGPIDASRFNFTPPQGVSTKNIFGF